MDQAAISAVDSEAHRARTPGRPHRRRRLVPTSLDSPTPRGSVPMVLLVDDDAPVRSFMRIALEATATLLEAPDGEEALRLLERYAGQQLDLILLDYVLPNRSGLEILGVMRRQWPWIPVVIITGFGSEDVAIHALRGGARDYLKKPIDVDQLRETVATLTARLESCPGPDTRMTERDVPRPAHRGIARALTYAAEHFAEPIALFEIAQRASLSKFHFCRLFHREMGVSFREYLQVLRVRRAAGLLAQANLSVTEVAYAAGFNDLSNFDKVFRRIVGVPPSVYRKTTLLS